MTYSFIPQRIKRPKQQITVKLTKTSSPCSTSMADSSMTAGITSSAGPWNWYSSRTKNSPAGSSRTEMLAAMRKALLPGLNLPVQHYPLNHSGMREKTESA